MNNDLKFTTAGDYMKDREPTEPCFMIEGTWANDTEEEKDEGTMGRKVSSKDD